MRSRKFKKNDAPSKTLERRKKFIYLARMEVGKNMATVLISREDGQLGKKIFLYTGFYVASLENGQRIWNSSFCDFATWVPCLGKGFFSPPTGKATHSWLRGVFLRMCKVMENPLISLIHGNKAFGGVCLACHRNSNACGKYSGAEFLRIKPDRMFLPCHA